MNHLFFVVGAAAGFLAVAFGAFGAHALKSRLTVEMFDIFEVGVRYHIYHALALLLTAWACERWPGAFPAAAGWLFFAGIVIFSGSLYALSLSGVRWLGAITPIGGLAFLAGWACLFVAALRS